MRHDPNIHFLVKRRVHRALNGELERTGSPNVSRLTILLSTFYVALAAAQTPGTVTIGGEHGLGTDFGEIRDVAILPGHIVVLDKNAPHLRVFDLTGRLLQTTGRNGAGPGEFAFPFSVAYDAVKKLVYVTDPANSRVVEYNVEADTLRLARSLFTNVTNLRDICFIRNRIFAISASRSHLLDELAISDDRLVPLATLGKPQSRHPLGQHPLVAWRASDGPLLCDEGGERIWVSSRLLGEVHRVELASGAQTMIPIAGFQPIRLTTGAGGRLTMSTPEAGFYNEIVSMILDVSTTKVVVGRRTGDSMTQFEVFSVGEAGGLEMRARSSWRQVGTLAGNVVCVVNDPYPTLSLFKGRACP
jgi:hypothetical protein